MAVELRGGAETISSCEATYENKICIKFIKGNESGAKSMIIGAKWYYPVCFKCTLALGNYFGLGLHGIGWNNPGHCAIPRWIFPISAIM